LRRILKHYLRKKERKEKGSHRGGSHNLKGIFHLWFDKMGKKREVVKNQKTSLSREKEPSWYGSMKREQYTQKGKSLEIARLYWTKLHTNSQEEKNNNL